VAVHVGPLGAEVGAAGAGLEVAVVDLLGAGALRVAGQGVGAGVQAEGLVVPAAGEAQAAGRGSAGVVQAQAAGLGLAGAVVVPLGGAAALEHLVPLDRLGVVRRSELAHVARGVCLARCGHARGLVEVGCSKRLAERPCWVSGAGGGF
jgi:hypothetical protein